MNDKEEVKNYDKVVELAKQKSEQREKEVLTAIKKMKENNEKISFYGVQKRTGASRSFLYGNETLRAKIEAERAVGEGRKKTDNSKDVIIKTLKMEIERLKSESKYKEMYDELLEEYNVVREKLDAMYSAHYNDKD